MPEALPATPGGEGDFLEPEASEVAEQVIGRHVVGDEQIGASVFVEVSREDAQPATVGVDDAGLSRHVDEPTAVVAEDVIRQGLEVERKAAVVAGVLGIDATAGFVVVPFEVVADVQVEVAVAIQVGERRRSRPVAIAGKPGLLGDVFKSPVALVAIEGIAAPARHEEVGPSVVVDITDRDPVAVPIAPSRRCRSER